MSTENEKAIINAAREYAHAIEQYGVAVVDSNKKLNSPDALVRIDCHKTRLAAELRAVTAERELLRIVFEVDDNGDEA